MEFIYLGLFSVVVVLALIFSANNARKHTKTH